MSDSLFSRNPPFGAPEAAVTPVAGRPRAPLGVAALVAAIGESLASRFGAVTVRGELQSFMKAGSGHCYFSLKDADTGNALIRCAMFRRAAGMVGFTPRDGQLVDVRGRVAVYEPRGELQFVVEAMQRAGDGTLYERFLQLKAKLEAEGLFDPSRKRDLPPFPTCVGVVTSLGAAALHDVLTALARRAPHVGVIVYPSLVQGASAPAALVEAIDLANRRNEFDTLIVFRGGGAVGDLWAFNDEAVVRAVRASALPVVVGVGHETDVSLADFAADVRAPTPTAAAELAAPLQQACLDELAGLASLMKRRVHIALERHAQRIDRAALRLARPGDRLRRNAQALVSLRHRVDVAVRQRLVGAEQRQHRLAARLMRASTSLQAANAHRLAALEGRLRALDPRQVLSRGYAWLGDADGQPVMSAAQVKVGSDLRIELADGLVGAKVEKVEFTDRAETPPL
ncbi:exodeoxyribonuclease VII large subunit [soil metagenome]